MTEDHAKERRQLPLDKGATKEVVKEALKEWLDEKFATFGKWTLRGIAAMLLAGTVFLFMTSNGWHK